MKITEKITISESKDIHVSNMCDTCGKVHDGQILPETWHSFDAVEHEYHESDWFDTCSPECYISKVRELIKLRTHMSIDNMTLDFAKDLVLSFTKPLNLYIDEK